MIELSKRDKAIELYLRTQLSLEDISRRCGCSKVTLTNWITHDIPVKQRRKRGRRKLEIPSRKVVNALMAYLRYRSYEKVSDLYPEYNRHQVYQTVNYWTKKGFFSKLEQGKGVYSPGDIILRSNKIYEIRFIDDNQLTACAKDLQTDELIEDFSIYTDDDYTQKIPKSTLQNYLEERKL